jgi:4-hydroxybenzoate polyprenyltransferase
MAQDSLIKRFWLYQKERFPFLTHGLLITCFSFSAVSYSRISRDAIGFIEWEKFAICIFNTITIFFLLRVFDEHKDAEDDAKYRSELPVPRGLISLKELRTIGLGVFFLQILVMRLLIRRCCGCMLV